LIVISSYHITAAVVKLIVWTGRHGLFCVVDLLASGWWKTQSRLKNSRFPLITAALEWLSRLVKEMIEPFRCLTQCHSQGGDKNTLVTAFKRKARENDLEDVENHDEGHLLPATVRRRRQGNSYESSLISFDAWCELWLDRKGLIQGWTDNVQTISESVQGGQISE
jgi:hypothetical protein